MKIYPFNIYPVKSLLHLFLWGEAYLTGTCPRFFWPEPPGWPSEFLMAKTTDFVIIFDDGVRKGIIINLKKVKLRILQYNWKFE